MLAINQRGEHRNRKENPQPTGHRGVRGEFQPSNSTHPAPLSAWKAVSISLENAMAADICIAMAQKMLFTPTRFNTQFTPTRFNI